MAKRIGAVAGLLAFAGAIAVGLLHRTPVEDILWRSFLSFWGGFIIGWLVFGTLGSAILAGVAKAPPAPPVEKKEGNPPAVAEQRAAKT